MRSLVMLLALVVVGAASPVRADFWTPSSWNPLAKGKSSSVAVSRSGGKKSSPTKASSKTMSHLTSAPSELISKTKHILPSSKTPKPASHSRTIQRSKIREEKPSLLKSMFVNEPAPPPRTVGEWMSLKRIDP